jgi:hypothetical protein
VWVPLEARLPAATGTGREDSDINREVVFTRYPIQQHHTHEQPRRKTISITRAIVRALTIETILGPGMATSVESAIWAQIKLTKDKELLYNPDTGKQRLFNYIDDNVLKNKLTAAKVHSFVFL